MAEQREEIVSPLLLVSPHVLFLLLFTMAVAAQRVSTWSSGGERSRRVATALRFFFSRPQ